MTTNRDRFTRICAAAAACGLLWTTASANDLPFDLSLQVLEPLVLSSAEPLEFGSVTAGQTQSLLREPDQGARFTVSGQPGTTVTGSVVEPLLELTTGDGSQAEQRIVIDTFTTGGDMDAAGLAQFDPSGQLNNLRIGATAHVTASNIVGAYQGNATFRLLYQ